VLIEPFTPSAHNDGVGGEMENGKVEKGGMGGIRMLVKEQLQRLRFSDGFPRHIANTQHTAQLPWA